MSFSALVGAPVSSAYQYRESVLYLGNPSHLLIIKSIIFLLFDLDMKQIKVTTLKLLPWSG